MIRLFGLYILTKKEIETICNDITISLNNSFKSKGVTMAANDIIRLKYNLRKSFKIFDKVQGAKNV